MLFRSVDSATRFVVYGVVLVVTIVGLSIASQRAQRARADKVDSEVKVSA